MVFKEISNVFIYATRAFALLLNITPDPADDDPMNLDDEDSDHLRRRSLMSMLVHWTYFRDLNVVEHVLAKKLGYSNPRAMKYRDEHWEPYHRMEEESELDRKEEESELKELGLAFLRRKRTHKNRNAPDLAILLRGTILTDPADLIADLKIAVQKLHKSDRVLRTVKLIVQVVERYLDENPNGQKHICMAGHSLGAAIALIVGGTLYATYEIDIDTHLFNPPLVTVVDVLTALHRPAPPAGFYVGVIPDAELKVDFAKLKEVFVKAFGDKEAINDEWELFKKLQNWVPHFYLNPGDPVCRLYIDFYMGQTLQNPSDVISYQGLLSSLFSRKAKYFKDVVPSADLHISNWKEGDARLAHSLRQWHKFKPRYINLMEVYFARLLRQKRSFITRNPLFYKVFSLRG